MAYLLGGDFGVNLGGLYVRVPQKAAHRFDGYAVRQKYGRGVRVACHMVGQTHLEAALSAYIFEELSFEDWERVFFANIHFPVFLLQKIVGRINKGGSIVFTGSLMGIQPHSVSLAYGVTKSAVHALVKNMVKFLVPYELRVNAVAPGFVDTEWQKTKPAEIRRNIENKVSLGRFCDPDELAEVYKMLIENSYFNGEVVVVDGGYSYK